MLRLRETRCRARLFGRFVLAVCLLVIGCHRAEETTTPNARIGRCTLETVIRERMNAASTRPPPPGREETVHHCTESGDVCDRDCLERARRCILASVAMRQPFVAVWTKSSLDGVAQRFAAMAQRGGDAYRITWLDYTFASAFDSRGQRDGTSHESIVSRDCASLVDLRDASNACEGRERARGCEVSRAKREAALELECVASGERTLCDEPVMSILEKGSRDFVTMAGARRHRIAHALRIPYVEPPLAWNDGQGEDER